MMLAGSEPVDMGSEVVVRVLEGAERIAGCLNFLRVFGKLAVKLEQGVA